MDILEYWIDMDVGSHAVQCTMDECILYTFAT